ncbi:MAG TPA: VOC family protein [Nitrososphaerales archaeon]|nr:VOC family protein [Nitrososphaerales archaeon]
MGELHHIQVNVSDLKVSDKFYDDFLTWLGYRRVLSLEQSKGKKVGWRHGSNSVYLDQTEKKFNRGGFHRKNIGLNHVAFWSDSKASVDKFYKEYLVRRNIRVVYGGPNEYNIGKGWYSVYFEDPDRLKLELVWTPP